MTQVRNLLTASAFLALAACAAGPRPGIPTAATVTVPAAWHTAASEGAIDAKWWKRFNDPVLFRAVETALASNSDLGAAAARVTEARAQLHLAEAQGAPTLNFVAAGGHVRDLNAFGQGVTQDAGRAQLAVAYDTDLFGRLANATAAARAGLLATEAARDNVRLAIAATTAKAYIELRASDAKLDVLSDTLVARSEALQLARRRAGAGYSGELEVQQAQAEYDATAQLIPVTRQAIHRQENALNLLLGRNPGAITRGAPLMSLSPPEVPVSLPSDLLRHRPDIVQAEYAVVAADRTLDSSRAAFMPSLQLSLTGGYVGSSLIKDPVDIFNLGGSLLAPVFSGGRLHAQADAAAARRDQAAFTYQKTVLNAFREVEDALTADSELSAEEATLTSQRATLARALALATERYDAGYSPYLEQLDAQRGLLGADLALIQTHTDRLIAAVSLFQALGGGWSASSEKDASHP